MKNDDSDCIVLVDDDVLVEHNAQNTIRNVSKRPPQEQVIASNLVKETEIVDLVDLTAADLTATTRAPTPDLEIIAVTEQPVPKKRKIATIDPQQTDAQTFPWHGLVSTRAPTQHAPRYAPPPQPQYYPVAPPHRPPLPPPFPAFQKKDPKQHNNQSGTAFSKLQKEVKQWMKEPLPLLRALPSPDNLLEWHYVLQGNSDSPYAQGYYHGIVRFPPDYPWKPPSIMMCTPNGRFDTNRRICLSMSDYHPESWSAMWNSQKILLGLQSFFYEDTYTSGSVTTTTKQKKEYAKHSLAYNVRNKTFAALFPDLVELHEKQKNESSGKSSTKK